MPIRCSTWFTAVLGELPDGLFDIRIEDQDHSARLLREGAVMGAVTTERNPVPFRRKIPRLVHFVPTADGFGSAVRASLGWGMYPEQLAAASLADGSFVRISDVHLDVPLYWQCWKLDSRIVNAVTGAVELAAASLQGRRE